MFFMPESPYYLVAKGKDDAALKSLQWLRGSENAKDVLEDVKREYREQKLIGSVSYVNLLTDAVYLRPFLIVMALMFFQQFSGINAVFFYLKVSSNLNIFRQRFICKLQNIVTFFLGHFHQSWLKHRSRFIIYYYWNCSSKWLYIYLIRMKWKLIKIKQFLYQNL